MKQYLNLSKQFLLNLFFPPICVNCQKEGSYLCQDCFSLIDFSNQQYCPFCQKPKIVLDGKTCPTCKKSKKLTGLFSAAPYKNFIIKKLIKQFKYSPYVKDLAKTLAFLIIHHLQLLENTQQVFAEKETILIPVPLTRKKQKQRGFNQTEEIGKELSKFLAVPLINNTLTKIKETLPQIELSSKERKENIKGVFFCKEPEKVKNKIILLIDDVFTTGATMEECAKVLKKAGAKQVWGITIARE